VGGNTAALQTHTSLEKAVACYLKIGLLECVQQCFTRSAIMELVLRKYGNSTALAFPPGLLRDLGLKVGQALTLGKTPEGAITLAPKRRHSLAELIAQCDPKAPPPADMALWEHARPAGQEVW
jgi:antitoxin ChpS